MQSRKQQDPAPCKACTGVPRRPAQPVRSMVDDWSTGQVPCIGYRGSRASIAVQTCNSHDLTAVHDPSIDWMVQHVPRQCLTGLRPAVYDLWPNQSDQTPINYFGAKHESEKLRGFVSDMNWIVEFLVRCSSCQIL